MKTILILEDNAREMERLGKIVREQGTQNEVICAVNLEQAYHMAMEKSIDLFLLDIILDEDCSSCKEIYYKAVKRDDSIGIATVYRMVNTLEDIGVISRKNMYKVACF